MDHFVAYYELSVTSFFVRKNGYVRVPDLQPVLALDQELVIIWVVLRKKDQEYSVLAFELIAQYVEA